MGGAESARRKMRNRYRWSLGAAMMLSLVARLNSAHAIEIGPEQDLCAELNELRPGDELVLRPGNYQAGCTLRQAGLPGSPIVIRGSDPSRRPRMVHPGRAVNVLDVRASDVVIRGLEFGPTAGGADGVRIISGDRVVVEECLFSRMGGIAVVANHVSLHGLTVRRNMVIDSEVESMYFGCHDGISCAVSDLVVEGNYIRGVGGSPSQPIGYGIQVKLNSAGVIRDNTIVDPKGPGIMIYGARDLLTLSVVERNFVSGSRTSSGIVLGGGPALVRNNVAVGSFEAGIGLENYNSRGLLRRISAVHNTVHNNRLAGIDVAPQGPIEAFIMNNAAHARGGTRALPSLRGGLRMSGNVDCSRVQCFANPDLLDFSPYPGSLLLGVGTPRTDDAVLPSGDFFGRRRALLPSVGAIEGPSGPIRLGVR